MISKIILASKSGVRKKILDDNNISSEVIPSNIDEDYIKESLLKEKETPKIISKNLAELKANRISEKNPNRVVLGADSVIDLKGKLISKPKSREEALNILLELNGQKPTGMIYGILAGVIEELFNYDNTRDVFIMRHYLNFLILMK